MQQTVTDTETEITLWKDHFEELQGKLREAAMKLAQERGEFERLIGAEESILLSTYDSRINEAITFFCDTFYKLNDLKKINVNRHSGESNLGLMTPQIISFSNVGSIRSAMSYCQAAIHELEGMKLNAELDMERIQVLRKGIPSIDDFTESTGTKIIPGSKGVNPLHLLKTDSQLAWELGKIAQKFKKIMAKGH